MNVLMASHYFGSHRGGIELVAARLARELTARDLPVTWLASNATPAPDPAAAGIADAISVPAWNIVEARTGLPLPLPGPSALRAIWRAVAASDVVVLHDGLYPTNVAAALAARWHGKPVLMIQHIGLVPYANPVLRALMWTANAILTRPMLANASGVVFISETVRAYFAGVRFRRAPHTIYNGVDMALFAPGRTVDRSSVRAAYGLPSDRPLALFVGRFVEKKGLHLIERIARQRPDLGFALAGWGPIDPRLWGLANVHVINGLAGQPLADLYRSSDVFILPSIGEGLPLVVQEAMAAGLPVVCGAETVAADPGATHLLTGIAIDPADHDGTSRRFTAALDGVVASVSADARAELTAYAARTYSWSGAADAYAAMLADICRPAGAETATGRTCILPSQSPGEHAR